MKIIVDIDMMADQAAPLLTDAEILIESLPSEQIPLGPIETIALTWDQRSRARRRCTTSKGTEVALALPRGTVLTDQMLVFNTETKVIQIIAELEEVVVVNPANQRQASIVAHHLGNWHRSMQLEEDGAIIVEGDSPLFKWLEQQKISFTLENRAYHPNLKGAAHE